MKAKATGARRLTWLVFLACVPACEGCREPPDPDAVDPAEYAGWWEYRHDFDRVAYSAVLFQGEGPTIEVANGSLWLASGAYPVSGDEFEGWAWGTAEAGSHVRCVLADHIYPAVTSFWHGKEQPLMGRYGVLVRTGMPLDGTFSGTGSVAGKAVPSGVSPAFALLWVWSSGGEVRVVAPDGEDQFCLCLGPAWKLNPGAFAATGDLEVRAAWIGSGRLNVRTVESGSVALTRYGAERIAGSFDLVVEGEAVSGDFDCPTSYAGRAPAADAFEPDDDAGSAGQLAVGAEVQSRTIHDLRDDDWAAFDGTAGADLYVETSNHVPDPALTSWPVGRDGEELASGGYDLWLAVYGSDGATSVTGRWDRAKAAFRCPADGTYYARTAGGPGSYDVRVTTGSGLSSDAFEADDDPGLAKQIAVDDPPQARTFHAFDDVDWLSFAASAGAAYYVRATHDGEAPPLIELHDAGGSPTGEAGDGRLAFECAADGTYLLRVGPEEPRWFASYDIGVSTDPGVLPDAQETDDDPPRAAALAVDGGARPHTLHSIRDVDWVSFEAAAGRTYYVRVTGDPSLRPAPDLFDTDGATPIPLGAVRDFDCPADGVYFLALGPGSFPVSYGLEVCTCAPGFSTDEFEEDDGPGEARPFKVNGAVEERTIHSASDVDWLSFQVGDARAAYSASTTGPLTLAFFDPDGATELASGAGHVALEFPSTGTYLLRAAPSGRYAVRYLLDIDSYLPDAFEPDDGPAEARGIAPDGPAETRTISPVDEDDWMSFPAEAGRTYVVRASTGFDFSAWLYVFDTDGVTALAYAYFDARDPAEIEIGLPAAGTYFAAVLGRWTGRVGSYEVAITTAP
jgi:hypothetical protein